MTRDKMDQAIRETCGMGRSFTVPPGMHLAFIAGMRAAADVIYHAPPGALFSRDSCRAVICDAAEELKDAP